MKARRSLTMRDIVLAVQDIASSDKEVVAVVAHLFRSRRVSLVNRRAAARLTAAFAK